MGFPLGRRPQCNGAAGRRDGAAGPRSKAAGIRLVFNLLTWAKSFDILILPIKAFN